MGKRKYEAPKQEISKKRKSSLQDCGKEEKEIHSEIGSSYIDGKVQNMFDIKQFRKELSAKQGQTIALTQFLQICLNPDSDVDYILEYLKSGGNSHEILRQIGQENKKNLTLATPAFHLFHLIILKVQSMLPHMIAINEEACRYFLNTFMPTVEIMISENSGPRHRKIILKLLTSIVTFNPDLGVEVLNQAPLTPKNLQHIVEKINYKEKDNVRVAFVHFITSFLVDGHLPLIKALLEKQGLLQLVIPGLVQDEAETVLMFLHILKKNVIDNSFLSKSLKLKTFSHQLIHNLFKLFNWKGPSDIKYEMRKEAHFEVMQLVSNILLTLFTNHKIGLYFIDSSLGTSDANKNQNLYKALLTLKRPWENENQCDVILQIVRKCPDLHRAIISIIEQSFEPQHSPIWDRAVSFVLKLLDILKPEDMLPKLSSLSSIQAANFIRFTTLPVPLLKFLQENIGDKDITISLYCIKILLKMLSCLKRYIELLELNNLKSYVVDLKNKLDTFIPKHLPGSGPVVSLIQKVLTEFPNEESVNDYRLTRFERGDALILLIDLLLYYQYVHPSFIEGIDSNLNMREILKCSTSLSCNNKSLLKFKVVSLWISLDSMAISLENPMFKDLLLIMLEVYTNDSDDMWIVSKDTLYNFFKITSIYDTDENEIHIMLYALKYSNVDPLNIADLIEYILNHNQQITELIKNQSIDSKTTNKFNEDCLNKLFNDLMENQNTEHVQFLDAKTPSLFIVGSMKFVKNNKKVRKKLQQFLSLYVISLLHCNYSPESIKALIDGCKLDVENYVVNWTNEPVIVSDMICAKDNILKEMSISILKGENYENVFSFNENLHDYNEVVDNSALIMWAQYLIFCIITLKNMEQLKNCQQEKISKYFKVIMDTSEKAYKLDVRRTIIASIFKSSYVLNAYTPVHFNKDNSGILTTQFLLDIISSYPDIFDYYSKDFDLLKPFKHKNYNELARCLIKIKKFKNYCNEHTAQVLKIIGMDQKDQLKILQNIFNIDLCYLVNDGKEPSVPIDLLRFIIDKHANIVDTDFSKKDLEQIMNLYIKIVEKKETNINIIDLELALISYFANKPQAAKFVGEELFKCFFNCNTARKSSWDLAATILRLNKNLYDVLKEQLNKPEILGQREITLSLGNVIIEQKQFLLDQPLMEVIYEEYKSNILKIIEKPHKAGPLYITNWKFIRELLLQCASPEDCVKIFNKHHKFEIVETTHISLFNTLFLKLYLNCSEQKNEYLINYFLTMLGLLTQALKESKIEKMVDSIVRNIYLVYTIYKDLDEFSLENKKDFKKLTENSIWHNFCKSVLRDCLKVKTVNENFECGPRLLGLLSALVNTVYQSGHEDISQLFDMVTSHSEFLNIMLSHHSLEIKSRLVELLFVLICKNCSVMKGQQIPVYLSAYHATRNQCDRMILKILHFYEVNGIAVHEYKPYIWGDSAANHYAVRKNRTLSLWGHPTPNQVLSLFDRSTVQNTVRYFPLTQKLNYDYEMPPNIDVTGSGLLLDESITTLFDTMYKDEVFNLKQMKNNIKIVILKSKYDNVLNKLHNTDLSSVSHTIHDIQREEVYDPAFLLPLLSHLLVPGSIVSCFKLFRSGLLCVPVMALSSCCPLMRAAAYHVLHRFYLQLETEMKHKNDKLMLTDFIDTLRQSLPSAITTGETVCDTLKEYDNPRIPTVDALYLAKALSVATAPHDPLYKPVNNFFIAKQFVDFTTIPDFLTLFHDSDVESANRRYWILDVISDGTKTMSDVVVVFKTMCLKMIMDFYSSVMSDKRTKEKILDVLSSLMSVPRAAEILIQGYGFIPWISSVIRDMRNDVTLIKSVMVVIRNFIYSMHVNCFNKTFVMSQKKKTILNIGEIKVPRDIETDILIMLYDLLQFSNNLDLDGFVCYLRMFNLLSSNVLKLLRKRQILNLISVSSERLRNPEYFKLLTRTVNVNNKNMLKSKVFEDRNVEDVSSNIKKEMLNIINKYLS